MKKIATILSISVLTLGGTCFGQELEPDQNPNYKQSMDKYMGNMDSLTASQSTTPQDTYVAYDWTEAQAQKKQEKKDRRDDWRRYRIDRRYPQYNSPYYNSPYNTPYYNNSPYYFWF